MSGTVNTKKPRPMIDVDRANMMLARVTECWVCGEAFGEGDSSPVRDHCHYTGEFRGIAHKCCNRLVRRPNFIPVFAHNLCGYDEKRFFRDLANSHGYVSCIPKNEEQFISFSNFLKVDEKIDGEKIVDVHREIRFLDSFKFMSSGLGSLVDNMKENIKAFKNLRCEFPSERHFKLLLRKGVYPYDYMDSTEKLKDTQLPPKSEFYSKLNECRISDDDYAHAQEVWKVFGCRTMEDYHNVYMKTNVLLLADVLESFRNMSLTNYGLDPVHFYTAPALAWIAALKRTGVKLELLTEDKSEMYRMFESGIRGGISNCMHRYARANNKYMTSFDPEKDSSYITYLDANNLYGWAMSHPLPVSGFEWIDEEDLYSWQDICVGVKGCIFEVDLEYPRHLHDLHNEYPLAPERLSPECSKVWN